MFFSLGSFIHKVAKTVGITSKDNKEAEHKEQFTALVREVKGVLNANNCPYLSVSILPHVNSSGNINISKTIGNWYIFKIGYHCITIIERGKAYFRQSDTYKMELKF